MKKISFLFMIILIACSENRDRSVTKSEQTIKEVEKSPVTDTSLKGIKETSNSNIAVKSKNKKYSNARFRNVTITKKDSSTYRITGEAQIFEASFNWVVEDGHNELKQGYEMTDAGAPEWGHFDFKISVRKQTPSSVLHLILFETSAKDGSRQYELPIRL